MYYLVSLLISHPGEFRLVICRQGRLYRLYPRQQTAYYKGDWAIAQPKTACGHNLDSNISYYTYNVKGLDMPIDKKVPPNLPQTPHSLSRTHSRLLIPSSYVL
jgi:hypothetical protein